MPFPTDLVPVLKALCPEPVEVVGGGVEGQSTVRFLLKAGYERVRLRDRSPEVPVPEGADSVLGEGYLEGIPERATVVRSAGIRPDLPAFQDTLARGGRLVSQLHLFLGLWQGARGARVAGVTGTFGKGTVVTLLSGMLGKAGIPHVVGGNIGVAMLDLLLAPAPPDLCLLELSSFQLCDLAAPRELPPGIAASAFAPRVAVCGRVTIEHLDWHRDQVEYWNAKARLCEEQLETDHAVHFGDDPGSVFVGLAGSSIPHAVGTDGELRPGPDAVRDADGNTLLERSEMRVPGAFQLANAALAWSAARVLGASDEACKAGAVAFKGLPHRLQYAGEADGVRWYNDSYATRPEACLAAVEALSDRPLALILGGSDKGVDFGELAEGLRASPHLRHVSLIGATAGRLRAALEAAGDPPFALVDRPDLPSAAEAGLAALGSEGGALLLSPACASFGLFRNYKQRGEAFLALARDRSGAA